MYPTYEFIFYLDAFQYNLSSIIRSYIETSTDVSQSLEIPSQKRSFQNNDDSFLRNNKLPIKWIQNLPIKKVNATVLHSRNSASIFFEMIAFLSSARSLLDSLVRFIRFRPAIEFPKPVRKNPSFHKLKNNIEECKMPINLKNEIVKSWNWVSDLIDYRDCLLHYTVLHRSPLPYILALHSEKRTIGLFAELPDNPKARKIRDFQFDKKLDYLGYAHSTYLKLFDLCYYVLEDTNAEVSIMQ
jgi:hypothetical protein